MAYVYIIQCRDRFKIGYTSQNPEQRLAALQTGNPYKLKIIRTYQDLQGVGSIDAGAHRFEYHLHRKWRAKAVMGEWFALSLDNIKTIDELAKNKSYKTTKYPLMKYKLAGVRDKHKFMTIEAKEELKRLKRELKEETKKQKEKNTELRRKNSQLHIRYKEHLFASRVWHSKYLQLLEFVPESKKTNVPWEVDFGAAIKALRAENRINPHPDSYGVEIKGQLKPYSK